MDCLLCVLGFGLPLEGNSLDLYDIRSTERWMRTSNNAQRHRAKSLHIFQTIAIDSIKQHNYQALRSRVSKTQTIGAEIDAVYCLSTANVPRILPQLDEEKGSQSKVLKKATDAVSIVAESARAVEGDDVSGFNDYRRKSKTPASGKRRDKHRVGRNGMVHLLSPNPTPFTLIKTDQFTSISNQHQVVVERHNGLISRRV